MLKIEDTNNKLIFVKIFDINKLRLRITFHNF